MWKQSVKSEILKIPVISTLRMQCCSTKTEIDRHVVSRFSGITNNWTRKADFFYVVNLNFHLNVCIATEGTNRIYRTSTNILYSRGAQCRQRIIIIHPLSYSSWKSVFSDLFKESYVDSCKNSQFYSVTCCISSTVSTIPCSYHLRLFGRFTLLSKNVA
jgi:hypothetical protein